MADMMGTAEPAKTAKLWGPRLLLIFTALWFVLAVGWLIPAALTFSAGKQDYFHLILGSFYLVLAVAWFVMWRRSKHPTAGNDGSQDPDEAGKFFQFLATAAASRLHGGAELQIMYGIGGERDLSERELDHLPGWRASAPVRAEVPWGRVLASGDNVRLNIPTSAMAVVSDPNKTRQFPAPEKSPSITVPGEAALTGSSRE